MTEVTTASTTADKDRLLPGGRLQAEKARKFAEDVDDLAGGGADTGYLLGIAVTHLCAMLDLVDVMAPIGNLKLLSDDPEFPPQAFLDTLPGTLPQVA